MTTQATPGRQRTALDAVAEDYVARYGALDPIAATFMGLSDHADRLTDYSPDAVAARADLSRATIALVQRTPAVDDVDRVTADAMVERLSAELALIDSGEALRSLNVTASPVQTIREVFDISADATVDDVDALAARLAAVPATVASYVASLRQAMSEGNPPARRQAEACAVQCDDNVGDTGFFEQFAATLATRPDVDEALATRLRSGAAAASQAYAQLGDTLRTEIAPLSGHDDAVGRERYAMFSRDFLGMDVDLDETYEWGLAELRFWLAEGATVAGRIAPGGIAGAIEALEADPARRIDGTAAFRDWMQRESDLAVAELGRSHFDIPEPARRLDCLIAPSTTGVIYYNGPSEDFSRPGTMWWSVPKGMTSFSTWQQKTTVYHEGVPGHHLQIASAVLRGDELNRFRRLMCWVPGHGEGWALYAERLMAELGYLDDPGDRMGLVASQLLRSARVVLDIGFHCGLPAPVEAGGGAWTYETAWHFLSTIVPEPQEILRFELDRYLGWAGQAPAYKIGERVWLDLRAAAGRRPGHDLVAWHREALDLGSVGLATLQRALGS